MSRCMRLVIPLMPCECTSTAKQTIAESRSESMASDQCNEVVRVSVFENQQTSHSVSIRALDTGDRAVGELLVLHFRCFEPAQIE